MHLFDIRNLSQAVRFVRLALIVSPNRSSSLTYGIRTLTMFQGRVHGELLFCRYGFGYAQILSVMECPRRVVGRKSNIDIVFGWTLRAKLAVLIGEFLNWGARIWEKL